MRIRFLVPILTLTACGQQPAPQPSPASPPIASPPAEPPVATTAPRAATVPTYFGASEIRRQWAKAENRTRCAPLAFTDDGGAGGTARAARFSGGWAVVFDLPGTRSAYGVAGPGLLAADRGPPYAQTRRLTRQWPYFMELDQFERPSFAGYGLEGAQRYRAGNPAGRGENSLAYVRIHRQNCTYNVWSRLGRAHLKLLLRGLQLLPVK